MDLSLIHRRTFSEALWMAFSSTLKAPPRGGRKKGIIIYIIRHVSPPFTKVFPSPRSRRRLCTSRNRNSRIRFSCSVDNTAADIPRSRSNAHILLYGAPKASTMETKYRSRRICRRKENNFKCEIPTSKSERLKRIQLKTFASLTFHPS